MKPIYWFVKTAVILMNRIAVSVTLWPDIELTYLSIFNTTDDFKDIVSSVFNSKRC